MKKIVVASVGTGAWGKNYVRVLSESGDWHLKYVCDAHKTSFPALVASYPSISFITDVEQIENDVTVQAVVIATPATTHYALAKRFLEKQKHVLVEKPLTTNSKESKELVELAERKKCILMVGFITLFINGMQRIRDASRLPSFGKMFSIYARRVNLGGIRSDVNVSWDLASHDIASFVWLQDGAAPVRVSATGAKYLGGEHIDVAFISLEFPNGVLSHIHASWADPQKQREITLVGSKMRLCFDDMKPAMTVQVTNHHIPQLPSGGLNFGEFHQLATGDVTFPFVPPSEPLKNECAHFAFCIHNSEKNVCVSDGRLGHLVVQILEAVDRSIQQSGMPISL